MEPASFEGMSTAELFEAYTNTHRDDIKWEIVLRHTGLIKKVAVRTRGLYSSFAEMDDIINEGLLVMVDAVDKYDPQKGSFGTFVAKRVWGMVIDLYRANHWGPRISSQHKKEMEQAIDALTAEFGRYPTDHEVAEKLGITDEVYKKRVEKYAFQNMLSWEQLFVETPNKAGLQSDFESPGRALENADLMKELAAAIETLRPNQQIILSLYYKEGLTMEEIASVMGVSRSRVCQIHKGAIAGLQKLLGRELVEE